MDDGHARKDDLTTALHLDRTQAWAELTSLADDFVAPAADDVVWTRPPQAEDGVLTLAYPDYSDRVNRAVELLYEVGAVTPRADWTASRQPDHRKAGGLTPDEAVLAATQVVRGERFCDGTIGTAIADGLFHVVLATLVETHRAHRGGPAPAPRRGKAPARHVYVGDRRHGQVTHIARDGRTRLVWNQDTHAFDVQELTWTTTGSWNKKQAYEQVKHGWDTAEDPDHTTEHDDS
ncbi:DUF6508 domain-containing protein [Embleya sp. NPDC050493]|uniref:DUF6508 domain-containing protein n=1 Tax=Embleya sp. NPDC050493 TaxID=3363989 RepID=UPI0037979DF2